MKTMIKNAFVIALATSGVMMMNSCKKEVETLPKAEKEKQFSATLPASNNQRIVLGMKMQSMVMSLFSNNSNKVLRVSGEMFDFPDCATVVWDSVSYPQTISVDFNNIACQDTSDKTFSGTLDVVLYGNDLKDPGEYAITTFHNVSIDGKIVDGTMRMEYSGKNGSGNDYGSVNFNITTSNKYQQVEMNGITDLSIESISPDQSRLLSITGTGSGTDNDGFSYTQTITSPLILSDCDFFVEGILKLESPFFVTKFVDYGDGTCDSDAEVIQGGSRTTVTLDE